jgi:hypothetical protein
VDAGVSGVLSIDHVSTSMRVLKCVLKSTAMLNIFRLVQKLNEKSFPCERSRLNVFSFDVPVCYVGCCDCRKPVREHGWSACDFLIPTCFISGQSLSL